jgi:sphingolipid delta-4 desaturase
MKSAVTPSDFFWSYTDEPHTTRRKEILAKYPQVKELYGYDPKTKYIVSFWVLLQVTMSYYLQNSSWWTIVLCAYCIGAFFTHALFLAMHEISHNLAFAKPAHNRLLGVFANLATVFPHFSMFQRYHMEHHQYQGVFGVDSDVPTVYEGNYFTNTALKTLWVFCQPLLYVFRPLVMKPKSPGFWEAVNWGAVFIFDAVIYYSFGGKSLGYLSLCTFLGSGLHPAAGHFIAEHYVFVKGQETYSYYGPLNLLFFNVGYHNEHHDFPRIPGSRLPQLHALAPEYYENLSYYDSWVKVIYNYITDPSVGPYSRMVRKDTRIDPSDSHSAKTD